MGKAPHKPTLLLSIMVQQQNNNIDLRNIPIDPNDIQAKHLVKTWNELWHHLEYDKPGNIVMPMYYLDGKEDKHIWNITFKEDVSPTSPPSSLTGLHQMVEKISLDEDLIEYIEDDDCRNKLIQAIFDGGYFSEEEKNNLLELDVFRGMSNGFDLRRGLLKVLDEYPRAKEEAFAQHQLANYIRHELAEGIQGIIDLEYEDNTKSVTGSSGVANWAKVPWIAVLDDEETDSVQRGVFVVYLFSRDMNRLYLTLMQGVTKYKEKYSSTKEARNKLMEDSGKIRELIDIPDDIKADQNINLDSGGYGKDYEYGTIFYKEYLKSDFPSDTDLKKDLMKFIDIYDDYLELRESLSEEIETKTRGHSNFFEYLHDKGFIFDKETVENFLLSLKVKPFVILTGTTGTGKTKLAQLYGQYLDGNLLDIKTEDQDKIITSVKVGKSPQSGGWSIRKENFFEVFPELEKLEKPYKIRVDGIDGSGNLQLTPRLFYSRYSDELIERLNALAEEDPNQRIDLEIEVDGDILSKEPTSDRNGRLYEIIPVGSDWTDNKNIVGFYNVITSEYQKTPALDLIFRANDQRNLPHMIILDEMNLSHVERYFSDFLSAIESGEKIPLHSKEGLMDVEPDLIVPKNLFIIGTVNIDETTYMFSPKVLDRANTLEFLTVPAIEYMKNQRSYDPPTGDTKYLEDPLSNIDLRGYSIDELEKKFRDVKADNNQPFWDVYSAEINKFQKTLKEANFDFGFRVINEITRFMYASWTYEKQPKTWKNWRRYFDAQIKQKMLPKVHGSQRELGNVLERLFRLCYKGTVDKQENLDELKNDANCIYRSSALKIHEMKKTLYNQRYVSFTK